MLNFYFAKVPNVSTVRFYFLIRNNFFSRNRNLSLKSMMSVVIDKVSQLN